MPDLSPRMKLAGQFPLCFTANVFPAMITAPPRPDARGLASTRGALFAHISNNHSTTDQKDRSPSVLCGFELIGFLRACLFPPLHLSIEFERGSTGEQPAQKNSHPKPRKRVSGRRTQKYVSKVPYDSFASASSQAFPHINLPGTPPDCGLWDRRLGSRRVKTIAQPYRPGRRRQFARVVLILSTRLDSNRLLDTGCTLQSNKASVAAFSPSFGRLNPAKRRYLPSRSAIRAGHPTASGFLEPVAGRASFVVGLVRIRFARSRRGPVVN